MNGTSMYILDTDIVIWILRNDKRVVSAIHTLVEKDTTAVSTITIAELYKNIFPEEVPFVEEFLSYQVILPVSIEIAKTAGYYWKKFHTSLKNLSLIDCLIAATAKEEKSQLATLNTKHFPMRDIHVINPLHPFD